MRRRLSGSGITNWIQGDQWLHDNDRHHVEGCEVNSRSRDRLGKIDQRMISTNFYLEVMMKTFRLFLILTVVCAMFIGSAPGAIHNASALAIDEHGRHHHLPPATHKEL